MNAGKDHAGGAEQRRYARVPINLDAYIVVDGLAPVPCTVRDFCYGGMFISAAPATYAHATAGMPATLYFALMVGGEKRDYQVPLSIARVVAKGMGVSFREADQETLQLLAQLAAPGGMPESATSGREPATAVDFAPEFAELRGPLQALAREHLQRLCERFIARVDDALFVAARDADNNVAQNRLLDGQREVRERQRRLRDEVAPAIARGIDMLGNPFEIGTKDPAAIGSSDLSLIEKDEFEEFLAVSEMVSELEPEFAEALHALGRRLSHLARRDLSASANPLGPSVLCNALAEPLKGLQSDRRVTVIVYRVMHEVMSRELGTFYHAVNEFLVAHGIVPVIEKDKPQIKRPPSDERSFDATGVEALADSQARFDAPAEDLSALMPGPGDAAPRYGAPREVVGAASGGPPAAPAGAPLDAGHRAHGTAAVSAAPPAFPAGVVAAPPSLPAGLASAGAPAAPGAVMAAPPTLPAGAMAGPPQPAGQFQVEAAVPNLPPTGGGAMTGHIPGFEGTAGEVWASGWTLAPATYAAPNLQRAYSTAQAQLALRRQIAPAPAVPGAAADAVYSTPQILGGLAALQREYAQAGGEPLPMGALKERIVHALVEAGAPRLELDATTADAIEMVAGLFGALLEDALIAKGAKQHLTRLQPAVHRAALLDEAFFARVDHPVRQVVDRVARLRDGRSEAQQQRHARVDQLVSRANDEFTEDLSLFDDVLTELDAILGAQEQEYQSSVENVVQACEEQQRVLEARRGQALDSTDGAAERSDLPAEWHKWLERARRLDVGERMLLNATSANPLAVTLVWKEARDKLFVFADTQGNKASTLTQQQVAMYLRRGILRRLDAAADGPLERALFGVVDRFHREVEDQATRDALTGFLLRRYFVEAIDDELADAEPSSTRSLALCVVEIENLRDINDGYGEVVGDALLAAFAAELERAVQGRGVHLGRLGGGTLAVCWPSGGIPSAYKRLQAALPALRAVTVPADAGAPADADQTVDMRTATGTETVISRIGAVFAIGVTGSEGGLLRAENLLQSAREACDTAREMGDGSIFVAGAENAEKQQFEQLVAYAEQALERGCLVVTGQHVESLGDRTVRPALQVAIGATDRNGKLIPPHLFAPALARTAAAHEVDLWALRAVLGWMLEHEAELEGYALVIVPLSGASMRNEDLAGLLMTEFMQSPVPPGRICFGLADHDVVDHVAGVAELIGTLREFGCRFVLDEFGSGHANYDYIKDIDIDFVTIRSGFVADAGKSPKDFAMAKSINELVHFMGKKTIAKQVPGADLAATMREIGIDFLHDQSDRIHLAGRQT